MVRAATQTGGRAATGAVIPGLHALSIGRPALPEPDGFHWKLLSDLARLESGHTPSRKVPEYWDGGIPWIGIRDATGSHGKEIADTLQHISKAGLENSSARILPEGTVCLSRTASVGYVVEMAGPMATSQDFVNWVCGPDLSSSYFRYLLVSEKASVRRFSYGTTHQTVYFPEAKAFHVLVPSRTRQDAVTEVLGALDDKITANSEIAKSASMLAQLIFVQATEGVSVRPMSELVSPILGELLHVRTLISGVELTFGRLQRTSLVHRTELWLLRKSRSLTRLLGTRRRNRCQ